MIADQFGGVLTLLIGSVLQMLALVLDLPAGGLVSLCVVSLVFGLALGGIVPAYALIVRARSKGAGRLCDHGDDPRDGARRLDVRLDPRHDRFLSNGLPERHNLERI